MDVYMLTLYEYNTFSYNGIHMREIMLFSSQKGAERYAKDAGLIVREYAEEDNHCTIELMIVRA